MKIRHGFVSNSSSSSYLAVGVSTDSEILEAIGWPEEPEYDEEDDEEDDDSWYALEKAIHQAFDEVGYGIFQKKGTDINLYGYGFEMGFIGIEAEPEIEKDLRLSEIKEIAQKKLEEAGVEVSVDDIYLYHGSCSSEY